MDVIIFDRRPLARLGLAHAVAHAGPYHRVGEAGTANEFFTVAASAPETRLIIGDPGSAAMGARGWFRLCRRLCPSARIIALQESPFEAAIAVPDNQCISVDRNITIAHLIGVICELALPDTGAPSAAGKAQASTGTGPDPSPAKRPYDDGTAAPSRTVAAPGTPVNPSPGPSRDLRHLSRRQRQILQALASGQSNKEIAETIGIAEGTVKAHIHAILRALGVKSRTQAVIRFQELMG